MAAGSMESFYRQKKRGDVHEDAIRQFDLNMRYGPCIGMSRYDRWECAKKLGMNPPQNIESLLKSSILGA
ncbi:hypothetical protein QQ045_028454 [Rhodiola kirilowii]